MEAYYYAKKESLENGDSYDIALKKAKIEEIRARTGRTVQSSSGGEYVAYDSDGKAHYFKTDSAAEYFARQNGTWVNDTSTSEATAKTRSGRVKSVTSTTKVSGGHSAKPKAKSANGNWASNLKI